MKLKDLGITGFSTRRLGGGGILTLLFTLLFGMSAWGDTRTLLANDVWGSSAIVQGDRWFESPENPVFTHDYIVTGEENKNTIRTPASFGSGSLPEYYTISAGKTNVTFKGNSLTLNNGATLVLKHQFGAYVTIPTLYLDGGSGIKEANGQDNGFLDGTFYIRGTSDNPVKFIGSCESYTYRWFKVAASLVGDKTAVIDIGSSADPAKGHARSFHVELHGDNSNYQGRFEVKGSHLHGVELVAKHANALGAGDPSETEPVLTLIDGGDKHYLTTFWGMDGYCFTNHNYTLNIQGNVRIGGRSADENGVGLYFDNETRITGNGSLVVKSYGDTGAAVAFNNVTIDDSVTGVVVTNDSCLVLGEGYSNTQPISIDTGSTLTISCTTLTGGDAALIKTGVLTKDAADKIKIVCDIRKLTALEPGVTIPLFTAPNLNEFDVSDFVFEPAYATEFINALRIENNTLTLTRPNKTFVYKTGLDGGGGSFTSNLNWSDNADPSTTGTGKAYLVEGLTDGKANRVRSGEMMDQIFGGDSLTLANGGELVIIGGILTFKDLRMGSGGKAWPVRSHEDLRIATEVPTATDRDNTLDGFGTVYASKEDPFRILFSGGNDNTTYSHFKSIRVWMKLFGTGDLAFIFDNACCYHKSWAVVTNDNSQFTGGIRIERERLKNSKDNDTVLGVDFANEAAFGGRASAFRADRLKFVNNPIWRCSKSYDMTDETRGITIDNGLTFQIEDGQTLNVANKMTGSGQILKLGTGMLGLGGDNTLSATDSVWVCYGGLTVSHENAISKRPVYLGLKNSIIKTKLRIEAVNGIRIKAGADAAFNVKRAEHYGNDITQVEADAIPVLEVDELENLTGASKEVTLFRYENSESLEDHNAFKAKFNLVFPSSGNYKVEWGTKMISEPVKDANGKVTKNGEFAVVLKVKPVGFTIILR